MDWIECSEAQETLLNVSRFSWPKSGWYGFNCEQGLTVTDLTGGIAWLWTYPGDAILRLPQINSFLELNPLHTGGYLSAGITAVLAYGALLLLAGLVDELTSMATK